MLRQLVVGPYQSNCYIRGIPYRKGDIGFGTQDSLYPHYPRAY